MRTRRVTTREEGFTLIELLIVLVIIAVLLVIAVPSLLGYRTRAADATVKSIIRSAAPAVSAFAADNDGSAGDADGNAATEGFQGMTITLLRNYDLGLSAKLGVYAPKTVKATYCLTATHDGSTWSALGPSIVDYVNNGTCT